MQIFSGSSNLRLAQSVATLGKMNLGACDISRFENGETRIRVEEAKVEANVALVQSLSRPVDEHVVEFCLVADALIRQGASSLTGVVPWLGYSKQDKVFLSGEALSAKVVAQILQTSKMRRLITFDLHNRAILGFFDIPVTELTAKPLFLDYLQHDVSDKTVVVAPDEGAVKASASFAHTLHVPIVYMDKRRDLETGEVTVVGMSGDVTDADVVIVDDLIVTGSTVMETAKYLKEKGARRVVVAATHHLYIPGVQEKLDTSAIDQVIVTDTVAPPEGVSEKLIVLSVAGLIVDELR